ncbi:hypothetical protein EV426DRAFT_591367 [Tirmania nivea]|nr:hypothetical protein EV426DRAFT_591367 [Tirmania nivea]
MTGRQETHHASPTEFARIQAKGKAPCPDLTLGPKSFPSLAASFSGGRKLANIAPKLDSNPSKPAVINTESLAKGTDSRCKRARVDEETQPSSHLVQQTSLVAEPLSDGIGSHMHYHNVTGFNTSISEPNTQSLPNQTQSCNNQTLATPFNSLLDFQNPAQAETPSFLNFPLLYSPHGQAPQTIHLNAPICEPPAAGVKICEGCDARLTMLRHKIMAIPDAIVAVQVLEVYFALRDNWHSCNVRGSGK